VLALNDNIGVTQIRMVPDAMIDSQSRADSPQKADLQIRKELLNALGLPPGAATVARRPTPNGDTLVVRMTASGLLPANRRPASFRGYPVVYEVVGPLEIKRR
jgi:hypothetical protein